MQNYKDDGIYKGFPTETDNGYKLEIKKKNQIWIFKQDTT
jgi:hypothetical protein